MTQARAGRAGLNLIALGERAGGVGSSVRGLVPALLEARPSLRLHLYTSRAEPAWLRGQEWSGEVAFSRLPVTVGSPPWHLAAQLAALPALAMRERLDVLHGVVSVVPVRIPRVASVATVHDLIWLERPDEVRMTGRERFTWRALTRLSCRQADRVITDSEQTRHAVCDRLSADPRRVEVAPLAVERPPGSSMDAAEVRRRLRLGGGRVLLSVGQKLPYKNQLALVEAMPELPADVRLVLPGATSEHEQVLERRAAELGVADRVRLVGWVSDEVLEGLYAVALAVVLPSFVEGFGLPVLEAMARGVPVACSDRSALREVAGDAALPFDPADQRSVTNAMRRLLDDGPLRAELAARGRRRETQFTWRRTAEATLAAYDAAVTARRRR